jgi:hypothetical protein
MMFNSHSQSNELASDWQTLFLLCKQQANTLLKGYMQVLVLSEKICMRLQLEVCKGTSGSPITLWGATLALHG